MPGGQFRGIRGHPRMAVTLESLAAECKDASPPSRLLVSNINDTANLSTYAS